jgi:hypothetical protein
LLGAATETASPMLEPLRRDWRTRLGGIGWPPRSGAEIAEGGSDAHALGFLPGELVAEWFGEKLVEAVADDLDDGLLADGLGLDGEVRPGRLVAVVELVDGEATEVVFLDLLLGQGEPFPGERLVGLQDPAGVVLNLLAGSASFQVADIQDAMLGVEDWCDVGVEEPADLPSGWGEADEVGGGGGAEGASDGAGFAEDERWRFPCP